MQTEAQRSTLKVILFADLHQYSRLVANDEIGTLAFVQECFRLFREECGTFGGEFIKTTGDGVLILFDSAASAVEYAMKIQHLLKDLPQPSPEKAQFRIGLHMGEVFRRQDDVLGHAINLAARLEGVSRPGSVCMSQEVYQAAHQSCHYEFRYGGRVTLKNIPKPVEVYHLAEPAATTAERLDIRLIISTIDGLSLLTEEGEPLLLKSQKARALLGFLALSMRSQESQDRLATLLWTDRSLPEARQALAKSLARIEKTMGAGKIVPIIRHGDFLSLNASSAQIDVPIILRDLNAGKINDVLLERSDWAEAILLGLEDVSPLFNGWLRVTRRTWQERISRILEELLERHEISAPLVRQAATALLLVEPCHERAAQVLVRHYLVTGNRSAASRVYEVLSGEMKARFSLQPSSETQALLRAPSDDMGAVHEPGPAAKRRIQRPAIAVAGFEARSKDMRNLVFGFRVDLIANLSKFREWVILEAKPSELMSGANYTIAGTGTSAGGQAEVSIILSRSEDGAVVWSEVFRVATDSWSNTQRSVISRIASSLEIYVSHDRLSRNLPGQPEGRVYDSWVRGEHLLTHWKPEDEDAAARIFEEVIAHDPGFAPAYASLASVFSSRHLIRPGLRPNPDITQRSLYLALRAVELDPLSARGQLTVAWSTALADRYDQAEIHYELATELNPNSPTTLISAALGMAFMGRPDAAKLLMDRAVAFSPVLLDYQWSHVAVTRYLLGDFRGTIEASGRSMNAILDTPGWTAAAMLKLGQSVEAKAAVADLARLASANWFGKEQPSTPAVLEWFLAAFPLKREEDRRELEALRQLI